MKKIAWFFALFAAFSLLIGGCGGAGGDEEDDKKQLLGVPVEDSDAWWLATDDTGERKYPGNEKFLVGEDDDSAYVHIFFRPHGITSNITNTFQITIEFELDNVEGMGIDMMWQCAYDGFGTWARRSDDEDYIDFMTPGAEYPISVRPGRGFPGDNWNEDTKGNGRTKLDLSVMKGLCIQMPLEHYDEYGNFKLTKVSFANVDASGNPVTPIITGPHPLTD